MAAEPSTNTNGVYDAQYTQPAELAASTPSHTSTVTQSSAASASQQKADPQEIGWYFVEQYYTTLSKTPERIHLFYSKKSQLVTGNEAEKVLPAVGTKAISEKIKALDIQDCKVRVLNVDSQSSFDNIVVQVIGELSNKSQPHHKFVQTFVLATQPNGYFVLNDIFRYLNDEEDEVVEDRPEHSLSGSHQATSVEEKVQVPTTEEVVDTEEAANAVDAKLESIDQPAEDKPNGLEIELPPAEVKEIQLTDPTTNELITVPAPEQPVEPEPTPAVEASPKLTPAQPAAAPAKKTWANMVGTKAPAVPALPVSTPTQAKPQRNNPPAAAVKAADTSNAVQSPASNSGAVATPAAFRADEWQTADHSKKAKGSQPKAGEGIVHAYLKNITEKVDARDLRQTLESYGELKYFDVSRPRNCAFVEFVDTAGYAAAVSANPHIVNGETIIVEERRPRPGTFSNGQGNFTRGGGLNAGRGRGAFQGRSGGQGPTSRDKPQSNPQRPAKPGNVTPKGRGQGSNP